MNKTKLKRKMIKQIVRLVKLDMRWTDIAKAIGVNRMTLRNWIKQGENSTRGLHYDLVCAIEQAKRDVYQRYVESVDNAALNPSVTTNVKEIQQKNGDMLKETHTKTEPPNGALALKVLERKYPDKWGAKHHIQIDWREECRASGKDPDALKEGLKSLIADTDIEELGGSV